MSLTTWTYTKFELPNDDQLKLITVRDGNYSYQDIAFYDPKSECWRKKDDSPIEPPLSVRAWADLLPVTLS